MWISNILSKNKPILALSPMADMTDSAFCQVVRQIGGADIVFREMVSAEAVVRENKKTLSMIDFLEIERPIVQQIFGADPNTMATATQIIMEHSQPDGIDINMGCPVYKITNNFNGAALMKEPERAANIIKKVKKVLRSTPLSVKIRLGWSNPDEFKDFIPIIEDAGADIITVHGRTKEQGYSGISDWTRIGKAKEISTVPLITNGDIHEPFQVWEALRKTDCDGVLIARGALGNPWFFKQALDKNFVVSIHERIRVVKEHARLHILQYGDSGVVTFRKHLSWYFKTNKIGFDIPQIKKIRTKLVQIKSIVELNTILDDLLKEQQDYEVSGQR